MISIENVKEYFADLVGQQTESEGSMFTIPPSILIAIQKVLNKNLNEDFKLVDEGQLYDDCFMEVSDYWNDRDGLDNRLEDKFIVLLEDFLEDFSSKE